MKRRTFLKSMAVATGAAVLGTGNSLLAAKDDLVADLTKYKPDMPGYWEAVRNQFLIARDYAYFNTGSIGSMPKTVIDSFNKTQLELQKHCPSSFNQKKWNNVLDLCAKRFGCNSDEIAVNTCTTEGNNIILNGIDFKEGDEVITTTYEHCGLTTPLLNMKNRKGIVIKSFEPDIKDGLNNVTLIEKLITPKTKLIFVSHIFCTNGQVMPAKEIGELAKAHNIMFALDGAQALGNKPLDVKEYGCDFYATSGHKWMLAPRRTGVLYVKKDMQDKLQATTVGAYSDKKWDFEKQTLELADSAMRYVYGTQSEALVYGIGDAIEFCNKVGEQNIWNHNRKLAETLVTEFAKIPKVELASPAQKEYRSAQITFRIKGVNYNDLCYKYLMKKSLRCRGIYEGGVDGVRVSCHLYNNENEIDKMIEIVKKVATGKAVV